jgi:hypothetical protein
MADDTCLDNVYQLTEVIFNSSVFICTAVLKTESFI